MTGFVPKWVDGAEIEAMDDTELVERLVLAKAMFDLVADDWATYGMPKEEAEEIKRRRGVYLELRYFAGNRGLIDDRLKWRLMDVRLRA